MLAVITYAKVRTLSDYISVFVSVGLDATIVRHKLEVINGVKLGCEALSESIGTSAPIGLVSDYVLIACPVERHSNVDAS